MIVTFANQKGGVGKSTICATYANHLYEEGIDVCIFETDIQQSLSMKRAEDLTNNLKDENPYLISFFNLKNKSDAEYLMQKAHDILEIKNDAVILLDVPGNITDDYLEPIFVHSDIIIVPYIYEKMAMNSTSTFIKVIMKLKEHNPLMVAKMVFVPNMVQKNTGTSNELETIAETEAILKRFGKVAPKLYFKQNFKRFNTLYNLPILKAEVEKCFSYLDSIIL